jgi:hypothetical protein
MKKSTIFTREVMNTAVKLAILSSQPVKDKIKNLKPIFTSKAA